MKASLTPQRLASRIPDDVDARGLPEHEPRDAGRSTGVETQVLKPPDRPTQRRLRLESCQVHAEADVRALRERRLESGVVAADVEPVGIREHGRIAIGAGERDAYELSLSDRGAAELCVPYGVAVDDGRCGLEA